MSPAKRKPGRPRKGVRRLETTSIRFDPHDRKALAKRFGGIQAAIHVLVERELRPTAFEPPEVP